MIHLLISFFLLCCWAAWLPGGRGQKLLLQGWGGGVFSKAQSCHLPYLYSPRGRGVRLRRAAASAPRGRRPTREIQIILNDIRQFMTQWARLHTVPCTILFHAPVLHFRLFLPPGDKISTPICEKCLPYHNEILTPIYTPIPPYIIGRIYTIVDFSFDFFDILYGIRHHKFRFYGTFRIRIPPLRPRKKLLSSDKGFFQRSVPFAREVPVRIMKQLRSEAPAGVEHTSLHAVLAQYFTSSFPSPISSRLHKLPLLPLTFYHKAVTISERRIAVLSRFHFEQSAM